MTNQWLDDFVILLCFSVLRWVALCEGLSSCVILSLHEKLTRPTKKLFNSNSAATEPTTNLSKYKNAEAQRETMPCNNDCTLQLMWSCRCFTLQCERGPCLLLLAFQKEACECISRVSMKGYKCLEAARSAPQYDLRVRQSIGRRQQGVPWGILCEVKWDPATKGFSAQRDRVTECALLFHVLHPQVHMLEFDFFNLICMLCILQRFPL